MVALQNKTFFRMSSKKLGLIWNLNKEHSPLKLEQIHTKNYIHVYRRTFRHKFERTKTMSSAVVSIDLSKIS